MKVHIKKHKKENRKIINYMESNNFDNIKTGKEQIRPPSGEKNNNIFIKTLDKKDVW